MFYSLLHYALYAAGFLYKQQHIFKPERMNTMNTAHMMLTIVIGGFIAFLLGLGVTKIIELLLNYFLA
ncbi:hypothetical protein BMEGG_01707 [Priestia megaterium]|nr:hypothetical protein [Priestia megaterium]SUX77559.1 Uncharacterised protein [Priestia megaterium]